MKKFSYTITDKLGIHAGPAGQLVQLSLTFECNLSMINTSGVAANMKNIFSLMGIGVKFGEKITIVADGKDENKAINSIKSFIQSNL